MALTVIRPGMLTTVQDLGRWGYQSDGVPVAGPMDSYSHARANRLVGNPAAASALEITLIGPELEADAETVCAVAGASFEVTVDGQPADMCRPCVVPRGARIRFADRLAGARAAFAVRGGFDVAVVLGSRATSVAARIGPFGGRALRAGDVLQTGPIPPDAPLPAPRALPLPDGGARVRIMRGPHEDRFLPDAFPTLTGSRFVLTMESNRMGYRLAGPSLLHLDDGEVLSGATPIGSLQVPASGQPILLMADRQTTGGYPRIATVITADLPIAGQLAPGDWIEFTECTREHAIDALRRQRAELSGDDR